jgi:hypothetical protein
MRTTPAPARLALLIVSASLANSETSTPKAEAIRQTVPQAELLPPQYG